MQSFLCENVIFFTFWAITSLIKIRLYSLCLNGVDNVVVILKIHLTIIIQNFTHHVIFGYSLSHHFIFFYFSIISYNKNKIKSW